MLVNETGLKGNYDFSPQWTPDRDQRGAMPPADGATRAGLPRSFTFHCRPGATRPQIGSDQRFCRGVRHRSGGETVAKMTAIRIVANPYWAREAPVQTVHSGILIVTGSDRNGKEI